MSSSDRSPVQVVPLVQMEPVWMTRWLAMPTWATAGPLRPSAFVRTSTYVFHAAVSGALSDFPTKSGVPSKVTAIRPWLPAVTSGNTVLPTPGGVMSISGPQKEPGIPPRSGLLDRSSIGETERNTWYGIGATVPAGATHTAYAFPWLSRAIHGKIRGLASVICVTCHAVGSW